MVPRLVALDLDGTLLTSEKRISPRNLDALRDMRARGTVIALASGRLGSSVRRIAAELGFEPALLTLNGAAVYAWDSPDYRIVYSAEVPQQYADALLDYAEGKDFALNFYSEGALYSVKNGVTAPWISVYHGQTRTPYEFVGSLAELRGRPAHKVIFVGPQARLDSEERHFRDTWNSRLYIVRTWEYYLEFLSLAANKATGLAALARWYGIGLDEVAAFGDADNDIPMLQAAGSGIAMSNATEATKAAAGRVSQWSNDEDGVAREWEMMTSGA